MDKYSDENTCRICLKKQDTVYSLFLEQKGSFPHEKLKKIGIKVDVNDTGPSCICCDCLIELDITVNFLQKCGKSNQILASEQSRRLGLSGQSASFKGNVSIAHENNAYDSESDVDGDLEPNVDSTKEGLQNSNEDIALDLEEPRCGECGSTRRCLHWVPPTTHTCPYCKKVFNRKFNYKLHLSRHCGSRVWWCARCGASAPSRWLADVHCAPRRHFDCPVPGCGKTYTTSTNLDTHLRVHSGERPFECSDCGKTFNCKNTLRDHVKIHTGALPYICPVCGKRFRTNKLTEHMATHATARLRCARDGCALRFASRPALTRHRADAHPPPPPRAPPALACALCPAVYRHRQSLGKHMRKHHQKSSARNTARNE